MVPVAMPNKTAIICQTTDTVDHFAGIEDALEQRGMATERVFPQQPFPKLNDAMRVVVVAETQSFLALRALREARRARIPAVLVMDGIVEWRNTFVNQRVGPAFLQPAPVNIVACAGPLDERVLRAWGNNAIATGLPRFDHLSQIPLPAPDTTHLLVATARRPVFNPGERKRLIVALHTLKHICQQRGINVEWRLTDNLDDDLAVTSTDRPLRDALTDANAVISTMSSLVLETMMAQRPVLVLNPFGAPLLQPGPARLQRELHETDSQFEQRVDRAITRLLDSPLQSLAVQDNVMNAWASPSGCAADRLAEAILNTCNQSSYMNPACDLPECIRLPQPKPNSTGKTRIVNCVHVEGSPIGGVTTWALRLAGAINARDSKYEMRVLFIGYHPDIQHVAEHCGRFADTVPIDTCVVDPTEDHVAILRAARDAIARLEPDIVLPNYGDVCYAAACQLQHRGARFIAIAHTHQKYYQDLLAQYHTWDAAVGVSDACMPWITDIAGDDRSTCRRIVYGVPISATPREPDTNPAAPIRLAYVGRIVQEQKRIYDLLLLIDGLEAREVPYELHVIGDGPDLPGWTAQLASRQLAHGAVQIHGRRSPDWVQEFLTSSVDLSVLVSEYEGTSITMLEAMGRGVVPVVTAVDSGVDDWIDDGRNGVVVPVGEPDLMAERISEIHRDRPAIRRLGHAAWETISQALTIEHMANAYQSLFDDVMQRPVETRPTDLGVRVMDEWRWQKAHADEPEAAASYIEESLRDAGYRHIAFDRPTADADAVIVREDDVMVDDATIEAWRSRGLGVAFSPHLRQNPACYAMRERLEALRESLESLVKNGTEPRIAIYGTGQHTRRATPILQDSALPIVGFIDDNPPPWKRFLGLPIVPLDRAIESLRPNAIVLSSDAWEEQMWNNCAEIRQRGIAVIPLYGDYEPTPLHPETLARRATA